MYTKLVSRAHCLFMMLQQIGYRVGNGELEWKLFCYGAFIYILTFDDEPNPIYTPQLLDLLKKYNAEATFFIVDIYAE